MSPWLWIFIWLLGVVGSIVVHELGHVLAGVRAGWEFTGVFVKPTLLAVGVNLEPRGHERRLVFVAAGGLVATMIVTALLGAMTLLPGMAGHTAHSLMWLNLAILSVNILPVPFFDGGHVLKGIRLRHGRL